ncbi:CerR family C-terminal domain-containing protein [Novosphingobium sp. BL-52-GroH]|uniref:CerR family C-terminal domain-containing protein n=1 Tax=Novosphingobium sp. BL-52-GroH TaxID=3349877 RepID=UPI00384A979D
MTVERSNRRPSEGGYARGDETRLRILEVALTAFGDNGYEGASTRAIATQAQSNVAALQYYFGSKDGLYRACAQHLVVKAQEGLSEAVALLDDAGPDETREALVERLCQFLDQQAVYLYADDDTRNWVLFLAREQTRAEPSEAFELIFEQLILPMHVKGARLVGRIMGRPADDPETKLTMSMLTSLLLTMRVSSQTTSRLMGWGDVRGERLDMVRAALRTHVESNLRRLC